MKDTVVRALVILASEPSPWQGLLSLAVCLVLVALAACRSKGS